MPRHDASAARPWIAGVITFALGVWLLDLAILRAGVPHVLDDTWEYGVAARHLLAGDGFRTSALHPALWALRDSALTVPVLVHGPLLPVLLAPLIRLLGPGALDGMAWIAALFAVLTALVTLRLGARLIHPAVGAGAAVIFTLSPLTLRAVHHDPALLLGAFLIALAADLLLRPRPAALAGGLVAGLACLVRPEMLLAAPLIGACAPRRAWAGATVGFVLCMAPWWWHNLNATGQPFFNLSSYLVLGYSDRWSGLSVMRDFSLPPRAFPGAAAHALFAIIGKGFAFLPHALKRMFLAPSGGTGWLACVGLVAALTRRNQRMFATCGALVALVPLAIMSLTVYDERYITPFLPFWALGAARGAETLSSFLPYRARRPRTWMAGLLLLMLPSFAPAIAVAAREGRELRADLVRERAALHARVAGVESAARAPAPTGEGAAPPAPASPTARLMFSDSPDFVAWTTRRPTLWLTREEWERLPAVAPPDDVPRTAPPARGDSASTWFHAGLGSR